MVVKVVGCWGDKSMINKRIERFIIQLSLSILIGGLFASVFYGIYNQTGILLEIGSLISKALSLIGAILIGLLVKRFVDYQDKIKDIELNSKAPSNVVELFEAQKDEYFKLSYRNSINFIYLVVGLFMVLGCLIVPLDQIKENVDIGYFIVVDAGMTVSTVCFLLCVCYEIIVKTEEARKAKLHFEKIKEIEAERQSLIEKLNKKIREQRDADKKDVEKFRGNKDFDLRGYLDTFKKDSSN